MNYKSNANVSTHYNHVYTSSLCSMTTAWWECNLVKYSTWDSPLFGGIAIWWNISPETTSCSFNHWTYSKKQDCFFILVKVKHKCFTVYVLNFEPHLLQSYHAIFKRTYCWIIRHQATKCWLLYTFNLHKAQMVYIIFLIVG